MCQKIPQSVKKQLKEKQVDTLKEIAAESESEEFHTPQANSLNSSFSVEMQSQEMEVSNNQATDTLIQAINQASEEAKNNTSRVNMEEVGGTDPQVINLENVMAMFEKLQLQVHEATRAAV